MTQKRPLDPKFVKIATGAAGFPEEQREHLRAIWELEGFDVPPFNPNPPSLPQKAKNLIVATATHAMTGFKNSPKEVQEARYAICKACPGGHYKPDNDSCKLCGCIMRTKTVWSSTSCPAGYWGRWKEGDAPPSLSSSPEASLQPAQASQQPQTTATASPPQSEPLHPSSSSPEEPGQQP